MPSHQGPTSAKGGLTSVGVARDLWLAVSDGDAEGIRRLLDPNVVWRTHSSGALSGSVRGASEVIDLFARAGELVDDLRTEVIDIYGSAEGAVMHYRIHAERGPRCLDGEVLLLVRVRAGRIFEGTTTPVDPDESERFWLSH